MAAFFMAGELPTAFVSRLRDIVPLESFDDVLASFSQNGATSFRVNRLKTSADTVLARLAAIGISAERCVWLPDCFSVANSDRSQLSHSDLATEGHLYIQDLASVLIATVVNARPGEEILDLAAAPGGKTLVMAAAMNNTGRIAAVESVKQRFFQLKHTVALYGATNVDCYLKDGRQVGRQVPQRFDKVLLDAPCSSESRFSIHQPETFRFWSEKKIADMQRKQKQLLHSAINAVKPGGTVVYSTCSYAPEENECVVDRQLHYWNKERNGTLRVVPVQLPIDNLQPGMLRWRCKTLDSQLKYAQRILPTTTMKGFFICALKKSVDAADNKSS